MFMVDSSSPAVATDQGPLSLAEQVMEHVRSCVRTSDMRPGQWYSAYQVAAQLGISRTPVRDGLVRLEEVGLIQFVKNRGFRIVPTTPEDVAEIFSIRMALEVPATRRAARVGSIAQDKLTEVRAAMATAADDNDEDLFFRLDRRFHAAILTAGGSSHRTLEIVERLRETTRLLGASTAGTQRTLADIIAEHEPILTALLGAEPDKAGQAMLTHLATTGRLLLDQALAGTGREDDGDRLWHELTADYDYSDRI